MSFGFLPLKVLYSKFSQFSNVKLAILAVFRISVFNFDKNKTVKIGKKTP